DVQVLQFDNKTFDIDGLEKSISVPEGNGSQVINLLGGTQNEGISIWSKNIDDKKPNYIEANFRILSENDNKNNDIRVEWQEADNGYYAKLSKDGLELYQKSKDIPYKKILLGNTETSMKNTTWYTLRVDSSNDSINLYLNDSLQIKVPRASENKTEGISKIGLTTYYNNVQFKPLKVGKIAENPQEIHEASNFYDYYYPLTLLALSKSNYDVFSASDPSAFSKPVVFVPDSLIYDNATLQNYLDYVTKGGTLVLINSKNNSSAIFNQLFSIKSFDSKQQEFTNIAGTNNHKVFYTSGLVNRINMTSQQNIDTVASYRNSKNESISPFILQKNFSHGGKIILLNSKGYFDSISNSPTKYFLSLSNISQLLPVGFGTGTISQNTSLPSMAFIGKMTTYGNVSLNSSSLSLLNDNDLLYPINASRIAIFNGTNTPIIVSNITIKDLNIIGDYAANINTTGSLSLPDIRFTHDYVGIQMPAGFNMTVKLSPKVANHIGIVTQNQSGIKTFNLSNDSRVEFYGIKPSSPGESIPVLLKRPEMKVDGHIIIKNTYLDGFVNERGGLNSGVPLDLVGHLKTKFDLVDKFYQPYRNSTRTTSITYLQNLDMDGNFGNNKHRLNLPGDIYFVAEERGQVIPLNKILTSSANIILVLVLISTAVVASKIIWNKKMLKKKVLD
ncbi:MAG TPA: hypothetical protein VJM74_01710, partial [Nitrososphaeraceae archaeon]|nr:hypothetical protein [Nitrososphaeraceae archaeon]